MNIFKFAFSIVLYIVIPLAVIILLIIINRKLSLLIDLVKKDGK